MKHFTIAIDGPGGAGKSTVAHNVAAKLGVLHLDTGAMYRAFACQALAEGIDTRDAEALVALAERVRISVTFDRGEQRTFVNGQDVTHRLRTPQISMATSDVATVAGVRAYMVRLQQALAKDQSMVLDGRDIGTRVLPDATLKIYLTARSEVRARRRHEELLARGAPSDYEAVLADVIARDHQDSTRAVDPLCRAGDAVTLDTSDMTQEQAEQAILELLEKKLMSQPTQTAPKHREKFSFFYHLAMGLSIFLFHTLMPVRYHNAERAEALDAPYILIGNHQSMIDPLLIGWRCRRYQLRFLGKKELVKSRLVRAVFRNMNVIPVDRHNMDMQAVRACLKTLADGHALAIFPEGTRYKQGLMEELESGVAMIALRGKAVLLPAYVAGKPGLFRKVDCYFGEPFSVAEIAAGGINREACDTVLQRITALYAEMAETHAASKK